MLATLLQVYGMFISFVTMRRVKKIGSVALGVYFLVLPLLFTFHLLLHDHHHNIEEQSTQTIIVESDFDCSFCDFYHDQIAIIPQDLAVFSELIVSSNQDEILLDLMCVNNRLPSLRSPPIMMI